MDPKIRPRARAQRAGKFLDFGIAFSKHRSVDTHYNTPTSSRMFTAEQTRAAITPLPKVYLYRERSPVDTRKNKRTCEKLGMPRGSFPGFAGRLLLETKKADIR